MSICLLLNLDNIETTLIQRIAQIRIKLPEEKHSYNYSGFQETKEEGKKFKFQVPFFRFFTLLCKKTIDFLT